MTRPGRIALISGGTIVGLVLAALITGIVMVQSGWLAEKIRERIVAEAEKATGGRVEIGALHVHWRALTAEFDNLVIHGTEPPGTDPLLAIRRVAIGLRIISLFDREFNVASVEADAPRAHLIIDPEGATNLPQPKTPRTGKPAPETILALKIGKFDVRDGLVELERFGSGKSETPWNARGRNMQAHVNYNTAGPRYDGSISIAPLDLVWKSEGRADVQIAAQVTATAAMEKNRVTVSSATVKTAQSQLDLNNVLVNGFTSPVTTAHYAAHVSLAEAGKVLKLGSLRNTGTISAAGELRYASAMDYQVTAAIRGSGIGYGEVPDVRLSGNVSATPESVLLHAFLVDALGGEVSADGELRKFDDLRLTGRLAHFDARALAALGGIRTLPYDGIVSGSFDAAGKVRKADLRSVTASGMIGISPAGEGVPVHGEVMAKYNGAGNTVELGRSWIELPRTRVDLTGTLGQRLDVRLLSHDLNDFSPVLDPASLPAQLAPQNGSVAFNGTVTGPLSDPRIAGHADIRSATWQAQKIDSLTGDFTAGKDGATITNAALVSSSVRAAVSGSIGLSGWKPRKTSAINATAQLTNADAAALLALAGQHNVPVSGTLNVRAQVAGTLGDPHATADLTLSKGRIYGEPYDSVTGHAQYLNSGAQVLTAAFTAGAKRVNASLRFDHPDKLTFNVTSNRMALNQIAFVQEREPLLKGMVQIKADGVIRADPAQPHRRVTLLDLNADLRATGLTVNSRSFGDLHLAATTKNGLLTARANSDVANAAIRGEATVQLTADYPVDAKLTFSKLQLSAVTAALETGANKAKKTNIDGSVAGELTLKGPARTPDLLTASLDVSQFELHPITVTGTAKNIPDLRLRNDGPVRATLSKSVIRVESARFLAPSTNLALTGTVALRSRSPFNLQVQGNMNLALAEALNADLSSSGELAISAMVRGNFANPDVSGRAELQKGEFHLADFSNGLTNANGVVLFSGTRATIQSLTAETGGGRVNVMGFAARTNGLYAFRLEAKTHDVRVRYPEGVSSVSDSDLTLAGTSERSEVAGTVTVRRISINPKSDLSTILAGSTQPLKTPSASAGFLGNMNFDVQIATAPDVTFVTSVAQSIEADANLRLRGTAANPAVLGRINITQGEINFFGNKYTINQGSISFFNPARIDPVLDIDLETKARGVDVVLTVTGPLNKLNVSYRSDPPLQFSDIVALLATGRTPTDPTLAVRDTGQSQSLQQIGATALIGQAIANPVAGRLQRFFGVSKIKIDPQLTGITGAPEARLTIEQQVSPELLFTYITDVSSTSTQLIRVEWDFNRSWSAILTREENGYVGIDFAFKKRFR